MVDKATAPKETKKETPPALPYPKLVGEIAETYAIDSDELWRAIKAECFPGGAASDSQMFIFLNVVKETGLNPFLKEIYAATGKAGKLIIGVQVDGWIKMAHRHKEYRGHKFIYEKDAQGNVTAVTCQVRRADWGGDSVGEFRAEMKEWKEATKDTWNQRPVHQLSIKAFNNAVRFTLGITGVYDPDDVARIEAGSDIETTGRPVSEAIEHAPAPEPAPEAPKVETPKAEETSYSRKIADKVLGTGDAKNEPAAPASAAPEHSAEAPPPPAEPEPPKAAADDAGTAKARLLALAKDLSATRMTVLLGQLGLEKLDDATPEQVTKALARLEKKK